MGEAKDDLLSFVQHCEVRDRDRGKTAFELSPVQRRLLDVLETPGAGTVRMKVMWRRPFPTTYRLNRRRPLPEPTARG